MDCCLAHANFGSLHMTELYLEMLKGFVWPEVSQWGNNEELIFMHDSAPSHYAAPVRIWLDDKFPGK
jgi:hypothetical protein